MVLKFRFMSHEQDDFIRDFEVLADQTFFNLHMAIQDNLHFDKSQIASFFTCSQNWEKEQEITLFELSDEEAAKVITMDNARIGDFMQNVHDKMIYVFDIFNERLFFIELVEKVKQVPSIQYPICSYESGNKPQQLIMDQLFGSPNLSNSSLLEDTNGLDDLGYNSEYFEDDPFDDL